MEALAALAAESAVNSPQPFALLLLYPTLWLIQFEWSVFFRKQKAPLPSAVRIALGGYCFHSNRIFKKSNWSKPIWLSFWRRRTTFPGAIPIESANARTLLAVK